MSEPSTEMEGFATEIDVQFASDELASSGPDEAFVIAWAVKAMQGGAFGCTIRFVERAEIAALNTEFRQRESATNVLAFETGIPPEFAGGYLGDIAICVPVVLEEAQAQDKASLSHFAHMVVHGVLHLRGFDHIDSIDAEKMEHLEAQLLALEDIRNPYD